MTLPTIQRTIGIISSEVGKAIIQERPQAVGQVARNAAEAPRLFRVETPEMTNVMLMDNTKSMTIAA